MAFEGLVAGGMLTLVSVGAAAGYKVADSFIPTPDEVAAAQHTLTEAEAAYFELADPDSCEAKVLITLNETNGSFADRLSPETVESALGATCGSVVLVDQVMEKMDAVHEAGRNYWNAEQRMNSGASLKFWGVVLGGAGVLVTGGALAAVTLDETYHW